MSEERNSRPSGNRSGRDRNRSGYQKGPRSGGKGQGPRRDGGNFKKGPRRDGDFKPRRDGDDRKPRRDGDFKPRGDFDRSKPRRDSDDRSQKRDFDRSKPRRDGDSRPPRRDFDSKPRREGDRDFAPRKPQPKKPPRPIAEGQENYYRGPEEERRPGGFNARPQQPRMTGKPPAARPPRNDGKTPPRPIRHATPARRAALAALERIRTRDSFAQEVIDHTIDRSQMSPEDKAFATRLVLGVVSTKGVLDEMLFRCMKSPSDAQPDVLSALRISAYEILFLGKADFAAVDQGVELARDVAPRAGGLANAVLRRLATVAKAFPFGDPKTDDNAFALLQGFPKWLLDEVQASIGHEEGRVFAIASNEPAPIYVAVNACKTTDKEMLELLTAAKGEPEEVCAGGITPAGCFKLESGRVLQDGRIARALNRGELLVSDASAQAIASLALEDEKPASLLEVGSGRGTKTVLIQSGAQRKYGSQIERYVAVDSFAFKGRILKERAETCDLHVSDMVVGDGRQLDELLGEETFEVVFLDAPCSGLGTLRRHQDIRWRIKPETIEEDAQLAAELLQSAAGKVAPGGLLVFSTCTVTRQGNVAQVAKFLESEMGQQFAIEEIDGKSGFASELVPGGPDAHFAVKLRRKA